MSDIDKAIKEYVPEGYELTGARTLDRRHIHDGFGGSDGISHIDMNAGGPNNSIDPVENITYPRKSGMREGTYTLKVHNYTLRDRHDFGFTVELEFDGVLRTFDYPKMVKNHEYITVAKFKYSRTTGIEIIESLPEVSSSKTVWNINTQQWHKVRMVMNSPNHWDGNATGNKHLFMILEHCKKEGETRGFYNEFLTDDLRDHRKVFEVLGSKMKAPEYGEQLSGVGFSSTVRASVLCRVRGAFNRVIEVTM
jgi:hypothetical protein